MEGASNLVKSIRPKKLLAVPPGEFNSSKAFFSVSNHGAIFLIEICKRGGKPRNAFRQGKTFKNVIY